MPCINFDLDVKRDVTCKTRPTQTTKKGKTSKKEKRYDEASKVALGVLNVSPVIMESNKVESKDGIAMYYKKYIEPLLNKLGNIDGAASKSSDDDDANYGDDEDEKDRE